MSSIKTIAIPALRGRRSARDEAARHVSEFGGDDQSPAPRGPTRAHQHRYHVGQRMQLQGGGAYWARDASLCRVTALLPHDRGPLLYRVKSETENHERVVAEAELVPCRTEK